MPKSHAFVPVMYGFPRLNTVFWFLSIPMAILRVKFIFNLIRVAERFFSGVPQPPPPWRLLPESSFIQLIHKLKCPSASNP